MPVQVVQGHRRFFVNTFRLGATTLDPPLGELPEIDPSGGQFLGQDPEQRAWVGAPFAPASAPRNAPRARAESDGGCRDIRAPSETFPGKLYSVLHRPPHGRAPHRSRHSGSGHLDDHRQPHRPHLRGPRGRGNHQGDRSPPDQGIRRRFRVDDVRPGVHEHGGLSQRHHLHRRRPRHPALSRLPHRAAGRAGQLPRSGLAADGGRAADQGPARQVDRDGEVPHLRPYQHHQVPRGLPLRRASDGHAARRGRRALDVLSRRQEHPRSGQPAAAAGPAARQDADHRGVRLPALARSPVRLSRQRSRLHRQLRQHDVQHRRTAQAQQGAAARARDPADPARRPRAELLHQRGAGASAPPTWTRSRRSPRASRRCTARCTAARTRRSSPCWTRSATRRTSRRSSRK